MKLTRLLIGLIVLAVLLSACATATPTPVPTQPPAAAPTSAPTQPAAAPVVLKLEGPGGSKMLTMDDLKALPATEGWAGIKSSTGKITVPERFKGVAVDELCKLVGGLSPNTGVSVVAKDGYAMTISYDQIANGDFITYDPGTGDEIKPKDPLKVIIAYEKEGKPLPEDSAGTLRLVVVTAKNNQVVDGHWSVKWVNQIAVKSLAQEWKLPLGGAITEDMDRGTFQSCAAPACHGKTWTDGKAQVWSGVPLWLLAGRVDDEVKHSDGAYNDKLADQDYPVHVVAVDGYKVVLESARIKRNSNILVAYLVNGNPLDDKDFPLRLVGSDLQPNEMVGRIIKINLMLAAQSASTPQPTAAATAAPAAAGNAALTITGAVDKPQTLTMEALKGMSVVKITAEHPKKGKQDYEGVRLSALLDQAQVKSSATKLILSSSDGFTTEVTLADVRQCADCLLAFNAGKLDAVMPGMQSNFWARDVVKIEVK
jgi:DMSO/TMAO reductase YedYZ molybdopterin-dependent catalytic subunit